MRVRAVFTGFYDSARRRPGDEFEIPTIEHFTPLWMEPLDFEVAEDPDNPRKLGELDYFARSAEPPRSADHDEGEPRTLSEMHDASESFVAVHKQERRGPGRPPGSGKKQAAVQPEVEA